MFVQDRFQHIVPTLNKLGNLTVGLTLVLIGVLGIVESRQHNQEVAQQLQPITPEGSVIKGEYRRVYSALAARIFTLYCSLLGSHAQSEEQAACVTGSV